MSYGEGGYHQGYYQGRPEAEGMTHLIVTSLPTVINFNLYNKNLSLETKLLHQSCNV